MARDEDPLEELRGLRQEISFTGEEIAGMTQESMEACRRKSDE